MVVVGHAFILTGAGAPPAAFGTPIDTLGVYLFFAISGYLIAGSWETVPRISRFFRHRILRIFPALIAVILITVFVIGPFASSLGATRYFRSGETWNYLQGLVLLAQYELPGVFTAASHARTAVNGSLWTLGVEFSCYLGVVVLGLLAPRRWRPLAFVVVAAVAVGGVAVNGLWTLDKGAFDACRVVPFFALGSVLRLSVPSRLLDWRASIGLLGIWQAAALLWPTSALFVAWIVVPYAVVAIGMGSAPVLRRAARFGDLSYGTYLWAFLVQQMELDIAGRISLIADILVTLAITLAVAWLSWHLIERRAIGLASRWRATRAHESR